MRPLFFVIAMAVTPLASGHAEKSHAAKGLDHAKAEEHAFGRAADPKKARRTIRVDMTDQMRFHPAEITVRRGEVVRFMPVNRGQVLHEMVLGTMEELKAHSEMMRKQPGMEHDAPYMAHVAATKTGTMVWQFSNAGEFYFACLVPGHFEAGMIGKVTVTP